MHGLHLMQVIEDCLIDNKSDMCYTRHINNKGLL